MARLSSRTRWSIILGGLFSLVCVLILGIWGYDCWANFVPAFQPPMVVMPTPNGYDQTAALTAGLPPEPIYARLPRWPDGPPNRLRAVVLPVLPTLDAIRGTFRLPWRSPAPSGLLTPYPSHIRLRTCTRYYVAASLLERSQGNYEAAMQRSLDAMEFASKSSRGQATGLVTAANHSLAFPVAEQLVTRLPASAIPAALARVRRIRQSWPSFTEFLETERVQTLADATWTFQQPYHHPTPLHTLRFVGEVLRGDGMHSWSERKEAFVDWLEPKRYALQNIDHCMRQAIAESKKPVRRWRPVPLPGDPLSQMCLPFSIQMRPEWLWRVQTELTLLEVALAVRMHRLEHRRYPTRLADISRRWLSAIPVLPWGRPVDYRLRNGQPMISSIEPDGKSRRIFGTLSSRKPAHVPAS